MRAVVILLALGLTVVWGVPTKQSMIVGGSVAVVSQYPSIVALLYSSSATNFNQACIGSILTTKSIITASHCVFGDAAYKWRARAGSSWANSGGSIYSLSSILAHPSFNVRTLDNDVAILRTISPIVYSNVVQPLSIAGASYNLADNQIVWAAGWGASSAGAYPSEQLRHIQMWTINQSICTSRYTVFGANVTVNMLCSGWPNIGSRDHCQGDAGGPLYHNGVLVGISSWGYGCANAVYPGINARISRFATWIQLNA